MIDHLDGQIDDCEQALHDGGADHPYVPLLITAPGIGWVLAYTIAAEVGDIDRFTSPKKLVSYSGLCPRVMQSGERDRRGPLTKHGPPYLRWALMEATVHAAHHRAYVAHFERAPSPGSVANEDRKWLASRSPAGCAKRSGTCSLTGQPFHPYVATASPATDRQPAA